MHEEWSKARVIAALAALDDAGLGRRKLSEIAGVDHSTIGRWARGQVKPDYARVRRLALGIWRLHPELARELVEASGYPWAEPSEAAPEPPVVIDSALEREIRRWALTPEEAEQTLEDMRERRRQLLSGQRGGAQGDGTPAAS